MMSGQFADEVLDPAVRELERKLSITLNRDAIRERLEQEVGFADYGKHWREQFVQGLRILDKEGLRISMPDGVFSPADLTELAKRIRRHFPEPGPQSGLLKAPRASLAAYAPQTPVGSSAR